MSSPQRNETGAGPLSRGCAPVTILLAAIVAALIGPPVIGQEDPPTPLPVETGQAETAPAGGKSGAAPATAGEDENGRHPETYLEFAFAGGYLMIPIGICSVLLVAFLVERLVSTRRRKVLPAPFAEAIGALPRDSAPERVESICAAHPSSAARILHSAIAVIRRPREEIERTVNTVAQREIFSLRRYVRLFSVIAGVAPLIGLLGTVTGMIQAFREVAIQGLGSGQALAPGIYKALVTTAGGLLVAIPALIVYHWMNSRIDSYVHDIDNLVVDYVEANRSGERSS